MGREKSLPDHIPTLSLDLLDELDEAFPRVSVDVRPGMAIDQTERDRLMYAAGSRYVVEMLLNIKKIAEERQEADDGRTIR